MDSLFLFSLYTIFLKLLLHRDKKKEKSFFFTKSVPVIFGCVHTWYSGHGVRVRTRLVLM